jgi:hypothetical protein
MYEITLREIAEKHALILPADIADIKFLFTHEIGAMQEHILIDAYKMQPKDRSDIERLDTDYDIC